MELKKKIIEKKIEEYEESERPSDEFPAEPFSEHLVGGRGRGSRTTCFDVHDLQL